MPPPSCTGISSPITLTISRIASSLRGLPGDGAVQVDEVQPLRALLEPVLRHRGRVFGEHGDRLHVALLQANAVAVLDVDRGDDLHGSGGAAVRATRSARVGSVSGASVPGDEIGEQLQSGALTLFRMELRREDISPRHRASKRRRIIGRAGGQRPGPPGPDGSCARSRSARRPRCRAQSGCGRACRTGLQPMCGTLSRSPRGDHRLRRGSARRVPGDRRRGTAWAPPRSSSKSICRPRQMPRNGRSRTTSQHRRRRRPLVDAALHAVGHRRSGRAARRARRARIVAGVARTRRSSRPGATCASAFATERRLPMP